LYYTGQQARIQELVHSSIEYMLNGSK